MQGYVRASFSDRGMVADWVIHDKSDGNPHAHIMLTTRDLGRRGLGRQTVRLERQRLSLQACARSGHSTPTWRLSGAGLPSASTTVQTMRGGSAWSRDSYNPHVAESCATPRRNAGARSSNRCVGCRRMTTRSICSQHPAHILVVVQAQRAVFTRGDIVAAFRGPAVC